MALKKSVAIYLMATLALAAACARMGAPPGGPVDTEPPRVAAVCPAPDSTGVAPGAGIEITFSEKVSKQVAEKLISLSPPAGRLFFKWKGSRVRIGPESGLREDITYRLMVGPGLTDLHRVKN
ncbi:MAG: Ig-like domain-containing protein, partial [Gemmatimonadota bacterium]|nr:Ig-like domain-containing protein [Gemmatimonadota bacterium]